MTPSRRLAAVLLCLPLTVGTAAVVSAAPAVPTGPPPWPAARTLDASAEIGSPFVLDRFVDSDSGSADRAVWVAGRPGAATVRIAEGPPLRHTRVRDLSTGATRVGAFDAGTGLLAWYDAGRAVVQVVGIGAAGGQGTSYGVISPPEDVPGTRSTGEPVELSVLDQSAQGSAVVWTSRQPDGTVRAFLVLASFDGYSQTFTFGPVQEVAGPSDSLDQVRASWAGSRLLVASRTTAPDGSRVLRMRTGTVSDPAHGVTWADDQEFCTSDCADPTFAFSGVPQVLYREGGVLRTRVLTTGLGAPTDLGPVPSSYAVHDALVEHRPSGRSVTTRLAVATADSSGVRVWRANGDGVFGPARQVSPSPATGVALGARHGDDLVLWRQDSAVVTVRGRGDHWTDPVSVSGPDHVVDAGFSEAGSLPVVWYVDTVAGGERLRTSSLDDEGPTTTWEGMRRDRDDPRRLRLRFTSDDVSGIRITTVQVRFGRPGHLGPWGVFERLTHRGQREVSRTLSLEGRVGVRYCARARAVDVLGNVGAWGRTPSDDGANGFTSCLTVRR